MGQVVDRCEFEIGQRVAGSYTVAKVLGEGSFGKVYLVRDDSGTPHALKILRLWDVMPEMRKELCSRFSVEYETGLIPSPNLVRSEYYGEVGGNPFIIMEFCPGGDLTDLMGKAQGREVWICNHILNGLDALHRSGKVHRDLKPENVLFKADGTAALTDFGIVGDQNHRLTTRNIFGRPDQVFGTYAYMAPEQADRRRGGVTVKPTTDIFSFGVLAYQLVTGELPFGQLEDFNDLAEYQKRSSQNIWNRNLLTTKPNGHEWFRLIDACINPDIASRCQSARDALRMLPPAPPFRPSLQSPHHSKQQPRPVQQQPRPLVQQAPAVPRSVNVPAGSHGGMSSSNHIKLRVIEGEDAGRLFTLTPPPAGITIGRAPDNAVRLSASRDLFISRYHCTINYSPQAHAFVLRDGQWDTQTHKWKPSSNGTMVNNQRVTAQGHKLSAGDIIGIGAAKLRFE